MNPQVCLFLLGLCALWVTGAEANDNYTFHICDQADPGGTYTNSTNFTNGQCVSNVESGVPGNYSQFITCINETHYEHYSFFGAVCYGPWIDHGTKDANTCYDATVAFVSIVCNATTPANATVPDTFGPETDTLIVYTCNASGANASYLNTSVVNQKGCLSTADAGISGGVSGKFTCWNSTHYLLYTFDNSDCSLPAEAIDFVAANECSAALGSGYIDVQCPPIGASTGLITLESCDAELLNSTSIGPSTHLQGSCVNTNETLFYANASFEVHCYNSTHWTYTQYAGEDCNGSAVDLGILEANECVAFFAGNITVTCPAVTPTGTTGTTPAASSSSTDSTLAPGFIVLIVLGAVAVFVAVVAGVAYMSTRNTVTAVSADGTGAARMSYHPDLTIGQLQQQASAQMGYQVLLGTEQSGHQPLPAHVTLGNAGVSERDVLIARPLASVTATATTVPAAQQASRPFRLQ